MIELVYLIDTQTATHERVKAQLNYMELEAMEEEVILKNMFRTVSLQRAEEEDRQVKICILTCQNRFVYAARLIQRVFRMVRNRRRSVPLLQRVFRGFIVRRYIKGWHFYAQIIQRAWRSSNFLRNLKRIMVKEKLRKRAGRYAGLTTGKVLWAQYAIRRFLKKVHWIIRWEMYEPL